MKFIETCEGIYINTAMLKNIAYRNDELHVETLEDVEYQLTNERCLDEELIPFIVALIARRDVSVYLYKDLINDAKKERERPYPVDPDEENSGSIPIKAWE